MSVCDSFFEVYAVPLAESQTAATLQWLRLTYSGMKPDGGNAPMVEAYLQRHEGFVVIIW